MRRACRRWPARGFLPVEIVVLENVAEQVSSEIFVGDRSELEQRPFDRPARQPGLVGHTGSQQRIVLPDGATGRIAGSIPDATLLACPEHLHQLAQRIEAALEARIGIELHQNFLASLAVSPAPVAGSAQY